MKNKEPKKAEKQTHIIAVRITESEYQALKDISVYFSEDLSKTARKGLKLLLKAFEKPIPKVKKKKSNKKD